MYKRRLQGPLRTRTILKVLYEQDKTSVLLWSIEVLHGPYELLKILEGLYELCVTLRSSMAFRKSQSPLWATENLHVLHGI